MENLKNNTNNGNLTLEEVNKLAPIVEDFTKADFTFGLNLGNYFTKGISDFGRDLFKTSGEEISVKELFGKKITDVDDPKIIQVNNKLYRMTDADSIAANIRKRNPELLKATVAYAVARQLVKKKGYKKIKDSTVTCCVGLPILEYIADGNIDYVKKVFGGTYEVVYKGMTVKIVLPVKKLHVVAEGHIYYVTNQANIKTKDGEIPENIYIIDFGSRTVDSCRILETYPQEPSSLSLGTLTLLDDIKARTNEDFTEKKLEQMLRTGKTKVAGIEYKIEEFKDLVDNYVKKVVGKLDNTHKEMKNADKIIVFGGGSVYFKEYLTKFYPTLDIDFLNRAEFVNAESYYMFAQSKNRK